MKIFEFRGPCSPLQSTTTLFLWYLDDVSTSHHHIPLVPAPSKFLSSLCTIFLIYHLFFPCADLRQRFWMGFEGDKKSEFKV